MHFLVLLLCFGASLADIHRSKRFLLFPPTSPTRVQIIAGIGIPVELDYESVTLGYVLKAEYFLPDNTTLVMHFMRDPFNPITQPITSRRKRNSISSATETNDKPDSDEMQSSTTNSFTTDDHFEKYDVEAVEIDKGSSTTDDHFEKYDVEAVEIDKGDDTTGDDDYGVSEEIDKVYTAADYRISKPNDLSTARWSLFKGIEMLAERSGLAGKPCMLRSICESAHAPFSYRSGLLGELMHIIMTPSSTTDSINDHSQNEYLRAEELGRSGAPCEKVFRECSKSLLDQFTGIYGSMENLIKLFG